MLFDFDVIVGGAAATATVATFLLVVFVSTTVIVVCVFKSIWTCPGAVYEFLWVSLDGAGQYLRRSLSSCLPGLRTSRACLNFWLKCE